MKILSVVGARPQFVKAAVLSPALRRVSHEVLVHTGQHYDRQLSEVFFEGLGIPKPDYDLGIGSGTAGEQTGKMLASLDDVIRREEPHVVLVYGDTNSTLAGALAAVKLHVPVAHVEAGLRSFNRAMPEEINRIVTDHVASRLYCPTEQSLKNLMDEGINEGVQLTGDVMDAAIHMVPRDDTVRVGLGFNAGEYYVATIHRQENTDSAPRLRDILHGLSSLPRPVVLPLHPRTAERMRRYNLHLAKDSAIHLIEPLGYQGMLGLVADSAAVFTDSGGLQREAAALGVPCLILRDETEWVELVNSGRAVLVGADAERIAAGIQTLGNPPPIPSRSFQDPVNAIVQDLMATYGVRGGM